jgi:hypothetical protein
MRHSREGGNPVNLAGDLRISLDSRLRGNDETGNGLITQNARDFFGMRMRHLSHQQNHRKLRSPWPIRVISKKRLSPNRQDACPAKNHATSPERVRPTQLMVFSSSAVAGAAGAGAAPAAGTRTFMPQAEQRTIFPRALGGAQRMVRHLRFGQINRTI